MGQPAVDRGVQAGALPALLGGSGHRGRQLGGQALEDTLSGERYGFATMEALAAFLLRLVGEEGMERMEGKLGTERKQEEAG